MSSNKIERIPFFGRFYRNRSRELDKLTPEALNTFKKTLEPLDAEAIKSDYFKEFNESRLKNLNDLKCHDGKTLGEKNPNLTSEEQQEIDTALDTIHAQDAKYKEAANDIKQDLENLKELIRTKVPPLRAEAVIDTYNKLIQSQRDLRINQSKLEKSNIDKLFTPPSAAWQKMLDLGNPPDQKRIETTKKQLSDHLTATHEKSLKDFNKATEESLKDMHKKASDELAFIRLAAHVNAENKNIWNKGKNSKQKTGISLNDSEEAILNLSLNDITTIKTSTGHTITKNKDPDRAGKFNFSIEFKAFEPGYYQSNKQKILADMIQLTQAVKATGSKSIVFSCTSNNEKFALEQGQKAYEAAILQGFDPTKIKVKVNGKEMKEEELFKNDPSLLADIKRKGEEISKEISNVSKKDQEDIKEELARMKNKGKQPVEYKAEEVNAPGNAPGR